MNVEHKQLIERTMWDNYRSLSTVGAHRSEGGERDWFQQRDQQGRGQHSKPMGGN